jgi:hypothetical protein
MVAKSDLTARQPGHDRADRNIEDSCDLSIRKILQIKQDQGRPVLFVDFEQRLHHKCAIHFIHHFRSQHRQLMFHGRNRQMRKASAAALLAKKRSIQRGEQPGFDFCGIAKQPVVGE